MKRLYTKGACIKIIVHIECLIQNYIYFTGVWNNRYGRSNTHVLRCYKNQWRELIKWFLNNLAAGFTQRSDWISQLDLKDSIVMKPPRLHDLGIFKIHIYNHQFMADIHSESSPWIGFASFHQWKKGMWFVRNMSFWTTVIVDKVAYSWQIHFVFYRRNTII